MWNFLNFSDKSTMCDSMFGWRWFNFNWIPCNDDLFGWKICDLLYDLRTRALIHDRLFFDVTNLYRRIADHYYPAMADDLPPVAENVPFLEEGVHALNVFLCHHRMAASDNQYTIADISLLASVALLEVVPESGSIRYMREISL